MFSRKGESFGAKDLIDEVIEAEGFGSEDGISLGRDNTGGR